MTIEDMKAKVLDLRERAVRLQHAGVQQMDMRWFEDSDRLLKEAAEIEQAIAAHTDI